MPFSTYQTEKGSKEYNHFDEITVRKKNGLYVIDKLGISSGSLRINGAPIVFDDGPLYVSASVVEHIPNCYKAGEIHIQRD